MNAAGRLLRVLESENDAFEIMAWSPDGKLLATTSSSGKETVFHLWRTDIWEPMTTLTDLQMSAAKISIIAWHPHLPLIVTNGPQESSLAVWCLRKQQIVSPSCDEALTIQQGKALVQEADKVQLQVAQNVAPLLHIYISSASTPEDEALLDELWKQLSMVRRQPDVRLWEKRLISPGVNWEQDIATCLQQAHLILFLMSPDFLESDLCYEEMKVAIEQREMRGAWVFPVLIRHTASWEKTPVGALEPLPADRKPIRDRIDREEVMRTIAERIQDITQAIRQRLTDGWSQ
ncbi:hypothetical protein KSF_038820 [Reticulibacter mediterranei]|uniref:TIR domain-containing protein n=1 Tax=Reticulibacter mediterranei TaxID=2778369 RepID=A0A8J3N045_9CHLR|nr:hypothetical protein KSF_038820 [Reticulibacter mediterranei]